MSLATILPATLATALQSAVLLDVRTPAEYAAGHIPGAVNVPLFTNDERAEVGTLYKKVGPEVAFLRGLDFAGACMRWYVEEAQRLAPHGRVIVHCWRGGQRSGSMGWLLQQAGLQVQVLVGGYKAYRAHSREIFARHDHRLIIVGGRTGTGKTHILHALAAHGEHIIDLEELAHHKGSAFGSLGEVPQPSVEQFENEVAAALSAIPVGARVWLEDESRSIGRVYIPDGLWQRLVQAPLLQLEVPLEQRVAHLVAGYANFSAAELIEAFERITKRLGGQHVQAAVAAIQTGDYSAAARIALRYYDRAYDRTLESRVPATIHRLSPAEASAAGVAQQLIRYYESLVLGN